jgi:membrane protease YdiL (CAAX protease family)
VFNFTLFFLLVLIAIPGLVVTIPRQMSSILSLVPRQGNSRRGGPSHRTILIISFVQNLILVVIAAAVGTALVPRIGFLTPIFTSVTTGKPPLNEPLTGLVTAVLISAAAMIPFLIIYYAVVRPRLDRETLLRVEGLRIDLGIPARILYGGVIEEILFRWGLMTFLVWIGSILLGSASTAAIWSGIILSGLLFGLGHLPGISAVGARMTNTLLVSTIFLNLYGGVLFGWLFWQYGFLAAMLSHMVFHLIWLPFDVRAYRSIPQGKKIARKKPADPESR